MARRTTTRFPLPHIVRARRAGARPPVAARMAARRPAAPAVAWARVAAPSLCGGRSLRPAAPGRPMPQAPNASGFARMFGEKFDSLARESPRAGAGVSHAFPHLFFSHESGIIGTHPHSRKVTHCLFPRAFDGNSTGSAKISLRFLALARRIRGLACVPLAAPWSVPRPLAAINAAPA